jgi:SAM-dependent methyltransferase
LADEVSHLATAVDGDEGHQLARLLDGYAAAQVARVLALLAVPDHLGETARTAADLAAATGTASGPLGRLLAAATVYGLVTQDGQGRFALTGMGSRLRTDADGSMRNVAVGFLTPPIWQGFGRLAEIVKTGDPVDPAMPGGTWEYFERHPDDAIWFARAMSQVTSALVGRIAAEGYAPPAAERIVDVGGSRGTLLAYMLRAAPGARGVLFDRAEAMAEAPAVLATAGLDGRVEIVAGDFFDHVPDGDLHIVSNVLHDWEDDDARRIVANCHRASRPGGTLLVVGLLLPSPPRPSLAHTMDLLMMVVEGGRERTLEELQSLMAAEGYAFARDTPLEDVLPWHIVEFRRA